MIYVASVYSLYAKGNSQKSITLREKRYKYAVKRVAEFMSEGWEGVISPIVHCHKPSMVRDLPKTYGFWKSNDRNLLSSSNLLVVLKMPNWKLSEGITDEVNFAKELRIPIIYINCGDYDESEEEYEKEN